MLPIKQTVEQLQRNSEQLSYVEQVESKEISLYKEGKVSAKCLAENIVKLKRAFPELQGGFFDLLEQMLDEEKFTDARLNDAINNLIKTCIYPKPTIAQILNYDKKTRTYTWDELAEISKDYSITARKKFWQQYAYVEKLDRYVLKEYEKFFSE